MKLGFSIYAWCMKLACSLDVMQTHTGWGGGGGVCTKSCPNNFHLAVKTPTPEDMKTWKGRWGSNSNGLKCLLTWKSSVLNMPKMGRMTKAELEKKVRMMYINFGECFRKDLSIRRYWYQRTRASLQHGSANGIQERDIWLLSSQPLKFNIQ